MQVLINPSKRALGQKAAEHGARLIREAIERRGAANIVIATGGSQFEVLEYLVQSEDIHWPAVTVFHLDEYVGMPITHPASFRRFLWEHFVRLLALPVKACNYIKAENDPQNECTRVSNIIKQH